MNTYQYDVIRTVVYSKKVTVRADDLPHAYLMAEEATAGDIEFTDNDMDSVSDEFTNLEQVA